MSIDVTILIARNYYPISHFYKNFSNNFICAIAAVALHTYEKSYEKCDRAS